MAITQVTKEFIKNIDPSQINPGGAKDKDILIYSTSTSTYAPTALSAAVAEVSNFTGSNQSLAVSGYQKFPGGLIMQWGTLVGVSLNQTYHQVVFPLTFTNSIFNVQATLKYDSIISGSVNSVVKDLKLSGCYIAGDHSTDTTTGNIMWQALGY